MGQFLNRPQPLPEGGQQQPEGQEAAWWCKLLARGVASIGAGIAIILGFWACISLKPICIGAGIVQILLALIVLIIELPCCFQWVDLAKPIAAFAENRSFLQKAIVYGIFSIIPIAMCFGVSTLFGAGLIFAGAVLYGLMALGRKADRSEMMARAGPGQGQGQTGPQTGDAKDTLIDNEAYQPQQYP